MQLQAATIEHDAPVGHHGVRGYRAQDEPRVLDVLTRSLKRWAACPDPAALWRWKHFANPFAPSCVLVHEAADGSIAGVVALMFWRQRQGGRVILCERTTDLATHPDHRRQGVASSFWGIARQKLIEAGVGMVFHTPNQNSVGFTRHSLRPLFRIRPRIGVRHPARVAAACAQLSRVHSPDDATTPAGVFRRDPLPVAALFNDRDSLAELISQDAARRGPRLQTARSVDYLYWRYAAHPTIPYYALTVDGRQGLEACLIFRIDRFGSARRMVVQELLARPTSSGVVPLLRRELEASVDYDLIQYYDSAEGWTDLLPGGSLPALNAFNFTVGMYDPSLTRAGLEIDSWSLTLGDLQEI